MNELLFYGTRPTVPLYAMALHFCDSPPQNISTTRRIIISVRLHRLRTYILLTLIAITPWYCKFLKERRHSNCLIHLLKYKTTGLKSSYDIKGSLR